MYVRSIHSSLSLRSGRTSRLATFPFVGRQAPRRTITTDPSLTAETDTHLSSVPRKKDFYQFMEKHSWEGDLSPSWRAGAQTSHDISEDRRSKGQASPSGRADDRGRSVVWCGASSKPSRFSFRSEIRLPLGFVPYQPHAIESTPHPFGRDWSPHAWTGTIMMRWIISCFEWAIFQNLCKDATLFPTDAVVYSQAIVPTVTPAV